MQDLDYAAIYAMLERAIGGGLEISLFTQRVYVRGKMGGVIGERNKWLCPRRVDTGGATWWLR